jgi:membrane protease YdiL (CAAX protease family)
VRLVPRLLEFVALFVAAPGLIALVSQQHRWVVLPAIASGALISAALLWSDGTFSRAGLAGWETVRAGLWPLLLRTGVVLALFLALLAAAGRWPSFRLPRENPRVWLGVLLLYPLLSAVPQELMYRTLFFHRYRELFPTPAACIAASALAFGWAHVMVHNSAAVLLATLAGVLLALTWNASHSLWLVGLEHSLYGAFVFSAGIGGMFKNGVRLVSSVLR